MSRFPNIQQGMVGQLLFAVLAVLGSRGRLKIGFPVVDDEGRDVEIHIRGKFSPGLAVQVKTTMALHKQEKRRILSVRFPIRPENMIDHPLYWYFFAHLDLMQMRFSDQVFLVPSKVVHAHYRADQERGKRQFFFQGNIEANADDHWTQYRLEATEVGARLIQLMSELPREQRLEPAALRKMAGQSGVCRLGLA